ncbi:lipid IV(A) 3-deoxy-D-manno-octulosonic acid transferase [Halomonas vilamensis]|uniref:3-deoxy-D-manno-octulosonic acid transferase n=1 Tax=Vreelandella vilamensis TaxID=531309 RepID=A0ABU1H3P8_9GAMM|nr:lipid IV(A) 3-deoxy-D-manno-octulosonic acid transferase [Halomonas vilamensis]MDR5898927.1 lipid IV(A) 3-deoxy-D-manno-octulosonic acid transferase [Halomonas vilamensis]
MSAWARYLYSATLYTLSPLIGWRVWREQVPTYSRLQRLGFERESRLEGPLIWLHCASVGEVRAATPLIGALLNAYPQHFLLVTTMTATGAQQVQALTHLSPNLHHRFLPLDFPGSAKRFVRYWQPALAIMFETELWPNLLHACAAEHIPVAVVNGRLSARAFARYQRFPRLMAQTLGNVTWLAAKSAVDAERFKTLGMPAERTQVVGSLKFEVTPPDKVWEESERLRQRVFEPAGERPIWVAGSTRDGEETHVLAAHRALRNTFPEALLILVPRHPQRFDEVARICEQASFSVARRSKQQPVTADTAVYLGDTLGELGMFYAAGDVAFVGGSLVPLGGHNVVEPASLGRFTLCGPSLENFDDVAAPLIKAGALKPVADAEALGSALIDALHNLAATAQKGAQGQRVVAAERGALERTLEGLEKLISQAPKNK